MEGYRVQLSKLPKLKLNSSKSIKIQKCIYPLGCQCQINCHYFNLSNLYFLLLHFKGLNLIFTYYSIKPGRLGPLKFLTVSHFSITLPTLPSLPNFRIITFLGHIYYDIINIVKFIIFTSIVLSFHKCSLLTATTMKI